jgi:hypothetical protein
LAGWPHGGALIRSGDSLYPCHIAGKHRFKFAGQLGYQPLILPVLLQHGFLFGMSGQPAGQIAFDTSRLFQERRESK